MINNNYHWMKYAVKIADNINSEKLRVSAVLVNNNELVSFSCNSDTISWANDLINKLNNKNINKVEKLFLTINTLNDKGQFDLNNLLKKINIEKIYLGLPDPKLDLYLNNDPIINNNIYRFVEALQEEIYNQNFNFYKESKQNIKNSEYFYNNRVSLFLKEKLKSFGINLETDEILKKRQTYELASYISNKINITRDKSYELINNLLSEAFDNKYSDYDYSYDIRSINTEWSKLFNTIYKKASNKELSKNNILNIGVGSGTEASNLFLDCKNITFVDIAPNGLKKIKTLLPSSKIIQSRAENLSMLEDNSYDLYVSLRTYNSSFFNTKQAIKEAYRILKHDAIAIISISNGFLDTKEKRIIPGIIIPKLGFVDLYRGLDMIRDLSTTLSNFNFVDIELTPTNGELYICARVKKK